MPDKIAGAPAGHDTTPPADAPAAAPAPPPAPAVVPPPPPAFTAPQPRVVVQPGPTPPPASSEVRAEVAPDPGQDAAEVAAQLRGELEAAKAARVALDARVQQAADAERITYLRGMGALGGLSDEHLLALAPSADPSTSDGREILHAWTEANGSLFQQRTPTRVEITEAIADRLPSNAVFGADLQQKVIASIFGSKS